MSVKFGFGGIPTDIDVRRLQEKFGVPQPGESISYALISEVLGNSRTESRFWVVTGAWRRQLFRENNLVTEAIRNEGFEFLDAHRRVGHAVNRFKQGLRRVGRASLVAASTDRSNLAPEEARVCDHIQNTGAQVRLTAATAARQLTYVDPVKVPLP